MTEVKKPQRELPPLQEVTAAPVEYLIAHSDTNQSRVVDEGDDIIVGDRIYHIEGMEESEVCLHSPSSSSGSPGRQIIAERENFEAFMKMLALGAGFRFVDETRDGLSDGDRIIESPMYFVPPVEGEEEGEKKAPKATVEQCQITHWITDASLVEMGGRIGIRSASSCTTDLEGSVPPAEWADATSQKYLDLSLLILLLQN